MSTVAGVKLSGPACVVAAGTCWMENRYEVSVLKIHFHSVSVYSHVNF